MEVKHHTGATGEAPVKLRARNMVAWVLSFPRINGYKASPLGGVSKIGLRVREGDPTG
jgi:hypothetical protein